MLLQCVVYCCCVFVLFIVAVYLLLFIVAVYLLYFYCSCCWSMSEVNVYTKQLHLEGKRPEPKDGSPSLQKMRRWQQQEEHEVTSPTTGQTRQHSTEHAQTKGRAGSDASSVGNPRSSSATPTMDLYSLSGFLTALLAQERILWERNELLMKSFKSEPRQLLLMLVYLNEC